MISDLQNCRVQQGDMYHLPLPANSFDAVTIHHVLHYAEKPETVIAEAARVLRPGGRLVVVDFAEHAQTKVKDDFGHVWPGFSEDQLKEWCSSAHLDLQPIVKVNESGKPLSVIIMAAVKAAKASKKNKEAA
jgi:ArsR family transcriptional regulator